MKLSSKLGTDVESSVTDLQKEKTEKNTRSNHRTEKTGDEIFKKKKTKKKNKKNEGKYVDISGSFIRTIESTMARTSVEGTKMKLLRGV